MNLARALVVSDDLLVSLTIDEMDSLDNRTSNHRLMCIQHVTTMNYQSMTIHVSEAIHKLINAAIIQVNYKPSKSNKRTGFVLKCFHQPTIFPVCFA